MPYDRAAEAGLHPASLDEHAHPVRVTYLTCCGSETPEHEPGCTYAPGQNRPHPEHALKLLAEFLDGASLTVQNPSESFGLPHALARLRYCAGEYDGEEALTGQEEARLCRIFALRAQELGL